VVVVKILKYEGDVAGFDKFLQDLAPALPEGAQGQSWNRLLVFRVVKRVPWLEVVFIKAGHEGETLEWCIRYYQANRHLYYAQHEPSLVLNIVPGKTAPVVPE
jgi:hypothetical protein